MTLASNDLWLAPHLEERVRRIEPHTPRDGEFVLCWLHHAVRDHENPALDVAISAAHHLQLPVLVYQGLGGAHPYNSDRHHTFIMQGARELQAALCERGIAYAFHLSRRATDPAPLHALAARAALVIAEDFPAPPFPGWTLRLAASVDVPVWAVDCACLVPMRLLGRPFARAYEFRARIKKELQDRIGRAWQSVSLETPRRDIEIGFDAVDLRGADLAELCAQCAIDHAVGPVTHTAGGPRAGYRRWETFLAAGLRDYHRLRNDAAVPWPRGVSRLSPYLHHGHVSPFRIAREAAALGSAGAEKFLDELLVWRELAHNFCFHSLRVDSLAALPRWARETLAEHRNDVREADYSWERFARGHTGDPLWDAAQTSLLIHGELHNNVRMTWAKSVLGWTRDPKRALAIMIDLNNRYSLDGNDPNSFGGLLYSLGLFDRPFTPEQRITGRVRARSSKQHAKRLDLDRYRGGVAKSAHRRPWSIVVIGAGLSGLVAARTLHDHGHRVRVFEKSRAPGGRMATRRGGGFAYDHGAQYFTVRDARFQRYVESWVHDGLVAEWPHRVAVLECGRTTTKHDGPTRYVATPSMTALAKHLAQDIEVHYETHVSTLEANAHSRRRSWDLLDIDGQHLGRCDIVLAALPAPQAAVIAGGAIDLAARLEAVAFSPCWAVMTGFDQPLPIPADALFVRNSPVAWAARSSSKPGRDSRESWVLHGTAAWSHDAIERKAGEVAGALLHEFFAAACLAPVAPAHTAAHRWMYASATPPLDDGCLWDADQRFGACGDWCAGSRVEGAFLSGMAMAGRVLGLPEADAEPLTEAAA